MYCQWHVDNSGTDFENSEIASPVLIAYIYIYIYVYISMYIYICNHLLVGDPRRGILNAFSFWAHRL